MPSLASLRMVALLLELAVPMLGSCPDKKSFSQRNFGRKFVIEFEICIQYKTSIFRKYFVAHLLSGSFC